MLWLALLSVSPVVVVGADLHAEPTHIEFTLLSGNIAWMDAAEACATAPEGPRALWLGIAVTNNHTTETLTEVRVELTGFTSNHYKLTADPLRYIGNLAPGAVYYGYWYVDYSGACQSTPYAGLTDAYTLTVTANNLNAPAQYTGHLTTRLSEGVGGTDVITSSRGSTIAIGQIFTQTVTYQFHPNLQGVLLQPTGDVGFADACFRLLGTEITASNVANMPIGTRNQLYFPQVTPTAQNRQLTAVYFWQAQCQAATTSTPWTNSGIGQPGKYSNRYGVYFTTFPEASLSLQVTSEVTPTQLNHAGVVTYTVRFTNVFTQPVKLNTITVTLASGLTFDSIAATSDVDESTSSRYPASGAGRTLLWRGIAGTSYRVPAASGPNNPGELRLIFKVNVPAVNGTYTQQSYGRVGKIQIGPTHTSIIMNQPTAVTLVDFTATPQAEAILITWETAAELDNLGFNLYRGATTRGPWMRLNTALIPPQFPGQAHGGEYAYLDTTALPGVTYYYRLEDMDISGIRTFHGPVWAIMGDIRWRIYLPLMTAP